MISYAITKSVPLRETWVESNMSVTSTGSEHILVISFYCKLAKQRY